MALRHNPHGNYRFLEGIDPYSGGVVADTGFEIVHATCADWPAYRAGFSLIEAHLEGEGRPLAALCAVQLRSPEPFSFSGFAQFNAGYRELLDERGLLAGEFNPIARTNVAPEHDPPAEPVLYGFAYTRPCQHEWPSFVVAGAGDVARQALDSERIVRAGETDVDAMREKAAHVMGVMSERIADLGVGWSQATLVNVYTVRELQPYLRDTLLEPMGKASGGGVHWHYCRPPIAGLEFEMDLRGTRCELNL